MKNLSAILLLFTANIVSGIAQGISIIAIPWYFAQRNDMTTFGLIYLFVTVISILWGPYSGTLVDRFNRKYIFLALTTVCGLFVFSISAYGFAQDGLPWYLVGLVFVITFLNFNLHYPNLYAFVQEITEREYRGSITSYIEIQGQLTTVIAGGAAAMLLEGTENGIVNVFGFKLDVGFSVEAWQIHEIFALDASTYLLAFIIISFIRFVPIKERKKEVGSVLEQLKTGLSYLQEHPIILRFGILSYSIFVAVLIMNFYLGANYVRANLNASGDVYANSEIYYAIGALLSGVAIRRIFKDMSISFSVTLMTWVTAALFAVLTFTASSWILYAMVFLLGITNAGTRIQRVNWLFEHVPNQVYGRASSIFFLSNIFLRIVFLGLFSLAIFQQGNNVIYACAILSLFLALTAILLMRDFKKFVSLKPLEE